MNKSKTSLVWTFALVLVGFLALSYVVSPGAAAPILQQSGVCFVEATGDNVTDYYSADASALQDAVNAWTSFSPTIKVAGTCAGVQNVNGYTQTLYIDKNNLTIQGGYTHTAWLDDPDPVAYPTILDAQGAGRVVHTPKNTKVQNVTLDGLHITNGDALNVSVGICWDDASDGGGLCLSNISNFTIQNSAIYSNTAGDGGGIYHYGGGDVFLVNTLVRSNTTTQDGGGIFNRYNSLFLEKSVISENNAGGSGGGIYLSRHGLDVINSTLSGNNSSTYGGAVYMEYGDATASFINSTVVSNTALFQGGALYRKNTPVTITNTLLAYNSDDDGSSPDCYGEITSGDYNLIQDDTGCTLTGALTHVITGTDPLLGPLADNGGDTWTHALQVGSPALNWIPVGTNGCNTTVTDDQRGVTRPQGSGCDIGAYELEYACFAEITGDDVTDFASQDASAVQAALDALEATSDTVKLAGTCAGVGNRGGLMQTAYVSQSVTLQGGYTHTAWLDAPAPGTYTTTLDAVNGGRVAYVTGSVDVTFDGLLITGGSIAGNDGGGIYSNSGSNHITITGSILHDNWAEGLGGGVFLNGGVLSVLTSTFRYNTSADNGGAIAVPVGSLAVTNSTFTENTAAWYGGAIYSEDVITVTGSAFTYNAGQDSGAIESAGGGWIEDCNFRGNQSSDGYGGGALYVYGPALTIRNSTFAENRTTEGSGGAIYNEGELSILNSTFYSNTATASNSSWGWGGAIANVGTLTVTHGTFVSNTATYSGTTLYSSEDEGEGPPSAVYLYNSLVGGANNGIPHCEGALSANVNNLIEDGSCSPMLSGDPRVGTLNDNGGKTQTISLLSDSPAIDAGDATNCAISDQRGYARNDWLCDLGAFEMQFTDGDTVSKSVATGGTYTFGPTLVRLQVEDDGGCLTGLSVQRVETNHPNATIGIQTGRYWTLTPMGCSEGFTATLTLPLDVTPSAYDKACRWDTSLTKWDCGQHEDNSGSSDGPDAMPDIVMRYPVTQLSDWAVGNYVGPNTVSLHSFSTVAGRAWLLILGLCLVPLVYWGWRRVAF